MVSKISYCVIFGIIVFTNGNPAYRQDSSHGEPQYNLKQLLGELVKQGKYDVLLNHHEDRPGTHHEDITQLTYNGGKPNSRDYNEKYSNAESSQSPRGKNLNYNSVPSQTSIQNLNLYLRKKPGSLRTVDENKNVETNENTDDVLTFLNELDKTLNLNEGNNLELRCYGNRCGESRDNGDNRDNQNINNDNNRHLRCNGKRCSIAIENDRNDNLRCNGNRCSRSANDRDDNNGDDRNDRDNNNRDIQHILRCIGEGCGINRDDDDDDDDREGIYTLRCVGDRCGINRDDDDDDDDDRDALDNFRCVGDRCGINRDGIDPLRCVGDRCGINRDGIDSLRCVGDLCTINRDEDDDDDDDGTNIFRCIGKSCSRIRNDDDGIDTLRCIGDRCSRDREDRDDDRDNRNDLRCIGDRCGRNRDNEERENLRCVGNRCGRSRIDYENQDASRQDQDDQEAEAIVDNLLSNYANLRGNENSLYEGSEKRNVMKQVKSLLANLKNGLIRVVHGVVGLKPQSARPVNK